MEWKRRLTLSLAVFALIVGIVACGGQPAEEPAPEEPAAEEPAEEPPAPAPEPPTPEEPPQEEEPEEPQLVGEINITDYDLVWDTENVTPEEAPYEWTVTVQNDTTQMLDITVMFDIVDANDEVIERQEATIRLAPAERGTIRERGTMVYDDANRVASYVVDYDWEIVEG